MFTWSWNLSGRILSKQVHEHGFLDIPHPVFACRPWRSPGPSLCTDCLGLWKRTRKTLAPLAFLTVATSKIVKIATPLPLYLILLVWMRLTSDRKVSRFWYLCLEIFCGSIKNTKRVHLCSVLAYSSNKYKLEWLLKLTLRMFSKSMGFTITL